MTILVEKSVHEEEFTEFQPFDSDNDGEYKNHRHCLHLVLSYMVPAGR